MRKRQLLTVSASSPSVSGIVGAALLLFLLHRRFGGLDPANLGWTGLGATVAAGLAGWTASGAYNPANDVLPGGGAVREFARISMEGLGALAPYALLLAIIAVLPGLQLGSERRHDVSRPLAFREDIKHVGSSRGGQGD